MKETYRDVHGRTWTARRLDALLGDAEVRRMVEEGARLGLRPDGGWSPGAVLVWAQGRYRREEAAALLLLLVTRFYDIGVVSGRVRPAT